MIEKDAVATDEKGWLLEREAELRTEADQMLEDSGLRKIILAEGFYPVGSYVMQTMTWRDLDFEREREQLDWDVHWDLGNRLAATGWAWRLVGMDPRREPGIGTGPAEDLYWGIRVSNPKKSSQAIIWMLDLWTPPPGEFTKHRPNRQRWSAALTDDVRFRILQVKRAICSLPEYRRTMLSVHVYEAVIDAQVRSVDEFMQWWQRRSAENPDRRD